MKKIFFEQARRVVVKIGSSLLIRDNKFNEEWVESLIEDLEFLTKKEIEIILVASGSVSLGKSYLKVKSAKLRIHEKQAYAACGQVILMNNFMKIFEKKGKKVAQILLTYSDTEDRRKSLNSRDTINEVLKCAILPIINENDSVAVDELKFGDNDRLAARVAQISNSDFLILLSDVDGLFTTNRKKSKSSNIVKVVEKIDKKIIKMASNETNAYGTGGMSTKLQAADIAMSCGCSTIICNGNISKPIRSFLNSSRGTLFVPRKRDKNKLKNWIAGTVRPSGKIIIDNGASSAISKRASLLPSGVIKVIGNFLKGDIVSIENEKGLKIGKGISYYDSSEIKKIMGKKTSDLKNILGYHGRNEIIHRDCLTLND